jgi:DNA invertase Pin-like site-specific DNA recombinase
VKLIAYLRVSTDRQAEEGLGLEVQEQAVRRWARANGHRVVAICRDEGVSGSNGLETRMGLPEALSLLKEAKARGLVVYRLDRLARDLVIQETLLAELRRMGAEVFTTSAAETGYLSDDPDDPSRKLIRQVLGAVAEYERAMISLRLRSGRARKAEKGGFAYGAPAFGYRSEAKELIGDQEEQAALFRISELHAAGASLRGIAATLEAEGYRPKRSARWHPGTLGRIVSRLEVGSGGLASAGWGSGAH